MVQSLGGSGRFSHLTDAGEILDHYVNSLEWRIPRRMWLDGPSLGWDARPETERVVTPGPGMLEGLVKLAHRSDDAILEFAQRWGPLWLCGHRKYWQHNSNDCRPVGGSGASWYTRWEPLQDWRDLAAEARAVLRIAQKLNAGQLGDPEDWKRIPGPYDRMMRMFVRWDEAQWIDDRSEVYHETQLTDDGLEQLERTVRQWQIDDRSRPDFISPESAGDWESVPGAATTHIHERLLSMIIDDWVDRGCVRLAIFRQNGKRSVRLAGGGLIGALAVQLVFEVCRTDGLAICTSCGTPYLPPKRRPRRDQNPYCSDCGLRAARRDAAARYRLTEKYQAARQRRKARDLAG